MLFLSNQFINFGFEGQKKLSKIEIDNLDDTSEFWKIHIIQNGYKRMTDVVISVKKKN